MLTPPPEALPSLSVGAAGLTAALVTAVTAAPNTALGLVAGAYITSQLLPWRTTAKAPPPAR